MEVGVKTPFCQGGEGNWGVYTPQPSGYQIRGRNPGPSYWQNPATQKPLSQARPLQSGSAQSTSES